MMKNRTKAVLAAVGTASMLGFSAPTFAQDMGFYAGFSLGQSSADLDCQGFACDDKDTTWRILGGYQFNRNLAVEVGYSDLGEVSVNAGVLGAATIEATAIEVVAVGILPLANQFSVYGKLGMYRGEADQSGTGAFVASASESNTDLTFGVGVKYDFTRNLGVRAEWQRYSDLGGEGVGGESDIDVISIGAIWRF
jgi:OmpA-OmpF porin, OOP family